MPRVLNKYRDTLPSDAIYIGRGSKWGNPYKIGIDGDRADVLAKYIIYLMEHPELVDAAKVELKDKDLICFCSPKPCHGDILLEIANNGLVLGDHKDA